jgi:uncharacterized protein (TIGR02391 family)
LSSLRTVEEIDAAIARLERRVTDVERLPTDGVDAFFDVRYSVCHEDILETIDDIFGPNSKSWTERYMQFGVFHGDLKASITVIKGFIRNLEEKKADLAREPAAVTCATFKGMKIHPRIAAACGRHMERGEYRSAVNDACIALIDHVGETAGVDERDGDKVAVLVFNPDRPLLAVNNLSNSYDRNEQLGVMNLFKGAMAVIRNPHAHSLQPTPADAALDHIVFLSMLAKIVDESELVNNEGE